MPAFMKIWHLFARISRLHVQTPGASHFRHVSPCWQQLHTFWRALREVFYGNFRQEHSVPAEAHTTRTRPLTPHVTSASQSLVRLRGKMQDRVRPSLETPLFGATFKPEAQAPRCTLYSGIAVRCGCRTIRHSSLRVCCGLQGLGFPKRA